MICQSGVVLVRAYEDRRYMNDLLVVAVPELSGLIITIVDGPVIITVTEPVTPGFCVVITT